MKKNQNTFSFGWVHVAEVSAGFYQMKSTEAKILIYRLKKNSVSMRFLFFPISEFETQKVVSKIHIFRDAKLEEQAC